ncbi:TIGR01457 family HAD-type hydrolase [Lysinibacillus sp. 54212]|uniref:TIGR01457 family HAD-type hydrolase n=1 Tax=Lysinibacillus sp. 54212 TaxID=3119829 RepID=UPI002FC6EA75
MNAYCFDLDGTVYRGRAGIDSAIRFIHNLQKDGNEPFYITNNSSKTPQQLQQALKDVGIDAPLTHIYSSAIATAKYIVKNYKEAVVQVIGSDGIRAALENEGIAVRDDEHGDVLVMGIDRKIDYARLGKACILVQNGAKLIGTNEDIKFPTEQGFLPGNGSFVRMVGNVAGVEPLFIGKPSPAMLEMIAEEHGLSNEDLIMVGDNYDTDILCGINFGCRTIHVNTGVTPTAVVKTQPIQPTYLVENLDEIDRAFL